MNLQERKGVLNIQIKAPKADTIQIHNRDNGVGREEAKRLRKTQDSNHTSSVLELIHNRLMVLFRFSKRQYSLTFHDLINAQGAAEGTEVIFSISYTDE